MHDFASIVRRHLGRLPLPAARADEIATELAHQLEDKFRECVAVGLPEQRAFAEALAQFGNWQDVRRAILSAEIGETVMWPGPYAVPRRASFAALALVVLLCLAPSFRQALLTAPEAWALKEAALSEQELRSAAERGLKNHDAKPVAFAALHLGDPGEASRFAEQAIAMDPSLTWIGASLTFRTRPGIDRKAWTERVAVWDPDNAVSNILAADATYRENIPPMAGALHDGRITTLAETTKWGEAMRMAFAAPRYDDYQQRRFELDREMVRRLRGTSAEALVWYAAQLRGPGLGAVQAYAGLVTRTLGPNAESAGRNDEAAVLYLGVVRFAGRLERAASWQFERLVAFQLQAQAFASLSALASHTGKKDEAAAYALLRDQAERSAANMQQQWEVDAHNMWAGAKRPALLAWTAANLVLVFGLASVAWLALIGFRAPDRVLTGWQGAMAAALTYAPGALLTSAAILCAAMLPYLRSTAEFNSQREVFAALAPFWFGYWSGWDSLGEWRVVLEDMRVPALQSLAVLIAGLVLLWIVRNRASTPHAE